MKICVIGPGAIGGALACRLALGGHSVSVIARGAHLQTIIDNGLTLVDYVNHTSDGTPARTTIRLPAAADPAEIARQMGVQDVIFITLKAHGIAAMLKRIAPLVGENTVVLPAINGLPWWYFQHEGGIRNGAPVRCLDPEGAMLAALDARHLIGCVVHIAGEVRAPGEVHYTGGRILNIGEIDRNMAQPLSPRVLAVAEAMNAVGFDVKVSADIRFDVWVKLIGNLSFNPVAALTGQLMNEICTDEAVLGVIRPMLLEGAAVAAAYGITIPITPDQRVAMASQLGRAKISMLQDMEQGRPLELAAIVESVIEVAEHANVPVPTVRMLLALTQAKARTRTSPDGMKKNE